MQFKRLKRRQLGAFSVEFAIGAMVMFLVTFGIFEISRLIYVINLAESSLRESSRDTRVWEGERSGDLYEQRLTQMFEKKGEIWHLLVDPKRYHLSISYFESLSDLIDDKPSLSQVKQQRSPLAIYEISYQYTPMFLLAGIVEERISRRILVTMEHEGGQSMKSKQHGAFTIELAFVLLFTSALLVFTGDIAFQLLNRVNLDRVNYSLVNVLKERTRFFEENLIVTSAEVDELDILAARLLGYGQTSENAPYGIRVEWIVNDRYSSIDKGIEGGAPCIPGDSLKDRGHLAPQTSADKRFPLYQVTLCLNTDSWFNQFWGDGAKHYIHSSSVMPGR